MKLPVYRITKHKTDIGVRFIVEKRKSILFGLIKWWERYPYWFSEFTSRGAAYYTVTNNNLSGCVIL